jgi:DNA-binding MarR family transcriptional regulator
VGPDKEVLALYQLPGHLIRRSKQKSTAAFMEAFAEFDVTPIQYAVLRILQIRPGLDRTELCELVGIDNSTIGGVIARLRNRKLLSYRAEGRRHLITSTPAAKTLLVRMSRIMPEVQEAILYPLTARERQQLIRLLSKLVGLNTPHWRFPFIRPRRRYVASANLDAR